MHKQILFGVSLLNLFLHLGCGRHESRSLFEQNTETIKQTPKLTEQELIQSEIQSGEIDKIAARLDKGLDPNTRLAKERSLLVESAIWRQVEIVKMLLARGANIQLTDSDGKSVRDHAQGNAEILRLLPSVVDAETVIRLFQWVENGDYRKLKAELDLGIDPNLRNTEGDTLLIKAVRVGSRAVASTLARYPGIEFSLRDALGKSALVLARELKHPLIEKELLARGATE